MWWRRARARAPDVAESDKEAGIDAFLGVLGTEKTKSKWGFKALKRLCKLNYELKVCTRAPPPGDGGGGGGGGALTDAGARARPALRRRDEALHQAAHVHQNWSPLRRGSAAARADEACARSCDTERGREGVEQVGAAVPAGAHRPTACPGAVCSIFSKTTRQSPTYERRPAVRGGGAVSDFPRRRERAARAHSGACAADAVH